MANPPPAVRRLSFRLLLIAAALAAPLALRAQTLAGADNFDDATLTVAADQRWRFNTEIDGTGTAFAEQNQRLEFTATAATGRNARVLGWISPSSSGEAFGADWQSTVKVSNSTAPANGFASGGIEAYTLVDLGGGAIGSSAYYGVYVSSSAGGGKRVMSEWGRWDAAMNGGQGGWVRITKGVPVASASGVLLRLSWTATSRTLATAYSVDGGKTFTTSRVFSLGGTEAGVGAPYANGFGLQLSAVSADAGPVAAGQITFDDMKVTASAASHFAGSDDFSGGDQKWEFFFRLPYLTDGTNGLLTFTGSQLEFTKGAKKGSYTLEWDGEGILGNQIARMPASYTTSWVLEVTATNRHVPETGTFSGVSIEVTTSPDSYSEVALVSANGSVVARSEAMTPSDPGVNLAAPVNTGVRLRIAWDAATKILTSSCSFDGGVTYSTLRTVSAAAWPTVSSGFYFHALAYSTSAAAIGAGQMALDDFSVKTAPVITAPPASQAPAVGAPVVLKASATAGAGFQWQRNGSAVSGATTDTLTLANVQPSSAGLYAAVVTDAGGAAASEPAIVGVTTSARVVGQGEVAGTDLVHPNGNHFDQVLVTGAAEAVTADPALNRITRTSFIDLSNDIVQVELSGPGTLSLVLDGATDPAPPVNYNQAVNYVKGHAGIVITGATEQTNVSVFSVGRATAVNQALFKDGVNYDGRADIAFIAIASANGKFGGVRAANAHFFASKGLTGIYAPGVAFEGPVFVGDISAFDQATPALRLGSADDVRVTGGSLLQDNGRVVEVSGVAQLKFTDGGDSHGNSLPAQANNARLEEDGADVSAQIVVNPKGP